MLEAIWYYMDSRNQRQGPVSTSDLVRVYRRTEIAPENLVWRDGMAQWLPLSQVQDELNLSPSESMPATPPPLPLTAAITGHTPVASPSSTSPQYRGIDQDDVVYAGFVRRWAALFVDQIILSVPLIILALLVGIPFGVFSQPAFRAGGMTQGIYTLLWLIAAPLYYAGLESSKHQATLGKRALRIKVTDDAGQRLSFGHALGRWAAAALSYLTFYIGFLMAAFTERKRALHDIVASTLVVDRWAFTEHPDRQQRSASGCLIAIVVAMCSLFLVIPILAAISIPAYQDYVIRSQVSEGTALADGSKTAVAEYYDNFRKFPSDNPSAGVAEPSSINGNYVSSVTITNGTITVAYDGPKANSALSGKVLALAPVLQQNGISWNCSSAAGTTIAAKYLPTACR